MRFLGMQQSQTLMTCFTATLVLWSTGTQASDALNDRTIQLEKPAYFSTLSGDNRQIQPGTYELAPLPDGLEVIPTDGQPPIQLAITLDTHDQDLSEPVAVSVPGIPEGDSSDRHILALFLPGGVVYEAEGTYSGIRSRAVEPESLITDPMKIYLEKPVHWLQHGAPKIPLAQTI